MTASVGVGGVWEGLNPPYSTIVADPPWPYEGTMPAFAGKGGGYDFLPYSSMTLDDIAFLPVGDLSRPGAHLYVWTTNRYLRDTFDIVNGWGFEPVTTLVWCKPPQGLGLGGRFTLTAEFVIFARDSRRAGAVVQRAREEMGLGRGDLHRLVRGGKPTGIVYRWEADDCLPTDDDWKRLQEVLPSLRDEPYPYVVEAHQGKVDRTWWTWPRGRHSEKPAAFLDVVEQVSPGPYVELFARAPRLGWDSWGKGYELPEAM